MPIYYEAKALDRTIDTAPRITPSTKSVLKKIIRSAPVADAEPVVRCENCTSGIMSDDNKYIICCRFGVGMELDDFCSYGERKNGGGGYATD